MKITNKKNLPQAFFKLCSKNQFEPTEKHYSATTLLKGIKEILLERRHFNEIESDCSDMAWLVFGTAVHQILEEEDETGNAEMYLSEQINDYAITGKCDLFNAETKTLTDWKTASTWKVKFNDFEDWKKQGLIYAWLLSKKNIEINKLEFHALLKDWSPRDKFDNIESPLYTYNYDIKFEDLIDIENFILDKLNEIIECEKLSDDDIPCCNLSERWNTGDKFAVMKKGRKTALRVLTTEQEAEDYMKEKGGDFIEKRLGEDKKCDNYCSCKEFCNYYKNKMKEKEE